MKKLIPCVLIVCLLCGCSFLREGTAPSAPQTEPTTAPQTEMSTEPPTEAPTEPPTEPPTEAPTEPPHSALYIPELSVEDVILYFNEVCLDSEYSESGDPSLVQKWTTPIRCAVYGEYTEEDLAAIDKIGAFLNEIEGFPGFERVDGDSETNLRISFYTDDGLMEEMGDYVDQELSDGIVHFWYSDQNEIYDEEIGIRVEIGQEQRNSIVLEEIYNGMGMTQDTVLRDDSIIWQYYTDVQWLSEIDELLMRLLYAPELVCGMDAAACEEVIRALYY